jgi:hypothetical protein
VGLGGTTAWRLAGLDVDTSLALVFEVTGAAKCVRALARMHEMLCSHMHGSAHCHATDRTVDGASAYGRQQRLSNTLCAGWLVLPAGGGSCWEPSACSRVSSVSPFHWAPLCSFKNRFWLPARAVWQDGRSLSPSHRAVAPL